MISFILVWLTSKVVVDAVEIVVEVVVVEVVVVVVEVHIEDVVLVVYLYFGLGCGLIIIACCTFRCMF